MWNESRYLQVVMFNAMQIRELMQTKPFKPFRILTSDGQAYEITNHDAAFVGKNFVEIGMQLDADGFAEYVRRVALGHITCIEDLKAA